MIRESESFTSNFPDETKPEISPVDVLAYMSPLLRAFSMVFEAIIGCSEVKEPAVANAPVPVEIITDPLRATTLPLVERSSNSESDISPAELTAITEESFVLTLMPVRALKSAE